MQVASNTDASSYIIKLNPDEAMELHEFLSKMSMRPGLPVDIANGLYNSGLSARYHEKWKKEYDL